MSKPLVSILIPNYRTPDLTCLCLRLIRKYTHPDKVEVIVIDNDSRDSSLDYLRSLSWIRLIERQPESNESAIASHSRALDLGLAEVNTRYVLSIHTDTIIKHPQWLEFLLAQIEKRPTIAGVGSWKLEAKPLWKQALKTVERSAQLALYHVMGQSNHLIEGVGDNFYYLRSHCALYKTDLIRKFDLRFSGGDKVAGKDMHKQLVDSGHEMVFLPSRVLLQYLDHINHATTVLNPELSTRARSIHKGLRRIQETMMRINHDGVLWDKTLDV
jgi:glycosyl transferase family 2